MFMVVYCSWFINIALHSYYCISQVNVRNWRNVCACYCACYHLLCVKYVFCFIMKIALFPSMPHLAKAPLPVPRRWIKLLMTTSLLTRILIKVSINRLLWATNVARKVFVLGTFLFNHRES